MVRTVNIDQTIPQYAEGLVAKRSTAEIGVLIGRAAAGKDYALQLVKCPSQEGSPAITASAAAGPQKGSAGSSKGKAQQAGALVLDAEWIGEHAAQVSRLLPGGLDVLGIYVFCPDGALTASTGKLTALLKDIQNEAITVGGVSDLLVLHIDSITGKCSAKELVGTSMKPCDVKPSSLVSNMLAIRSTYPLDIRIHCAAPGNKLALHEALTKSIQWEKQHKLQHGVALVAGTLPAAGKAAGELLQSSSTATEHLNIEFVTSSISGTTTPLVVGMSTSGVVQNGTAQYNSCGELEFSAVLDCRAFIHKREPVEAALEAVKADILKTLIVRIDVLVEAAEALDNSNPTSTSNNSNSDNASATQQPPLLQQVGALSSRVQITLPRRAFVQWRQGPGCYCDYLMPGEATSAALQRLDELVGKENIIEDTLECREEAAGGNKGNSRSRSSAAGAALYCNLMAAGAVGMAGLAALFGYMSLES